LSPDRPPGAANPYEIAVKGKVEGQKVKSEIKKVSHKKKLIKRKIKSKKIGKQKYKWISKIEKGKKKVEYGILMRQSLYEMKVKEE